MGVICNVCSSSDDKNNFNYFDRKESTSPMQHSPISLAKGSINQDNFISSVQDYFGQENHYNLSHIEKIIKLGAYLKVVMIQIAYKKHYWKKQNKIQSFSLKEIKGKDSELKRKNTDLLVSTTKNAEKESKEKTRESYYQFKVDNEPDLLLGGKHFSLSNTHTFPLQDNLPYFIQAELPTKLNSNNIPIQGEETARAVVKGNNGRSGSIMEIIEEKDSVIFVVDEFFQEAEQIYTGYRYSSSKDFHGMGVLRSTSQQVLYGEFIQGDAFGYGIIISHGRSSYEGQINRNIENGYGIEVCENHNFYIGEFKDGKKHGIGVNYFPDGAKYEGTFNEGSMNGLGIYTWYDKRVYKGEFKDNCMSGFGEFYWKDEAIYIGNHSNDKKQGFGIYFNSAEMKAFIGFWSEGRRHGIGKYLDKNKNSKFGLFSKGSLSKWITNEKEALNALKNQQTANLNLLKLELPELIKYVFSK
mmetsp:Transcript_2754/g.2821  ORF Transcript_2754/g.2821 Transcript_2754/m.2821 type:complete len:469 (+) Transcript_2754:25-1431(+)